MRITLISSWGSPCGISVYAGDVYAELVRRGHEVQVLAYEESLPTETKLDGPIHRVWQIGQPPGWQVLQKIVRDGLDEIRRLIEQLASDHFSRTLLCTSGPHER